MQVSVKKLTNGKWVESLEDAMMLDQYQGQDVVAKISDELMWCGNDKWYDFYQNKGLNVTSTCFLIAVMELAQEIFKSNRDERVAIMTVEGMSDADANSYCDSKPGLYGKAETACREVQPLPQSKSGCEEVSANIKGQSGEYPQESQTGFEW